MANVCNSEGHFQIPILTTWQLNMTDKQEHHNSRKNTLFQCNLIKPAKTILHIINIQYVSGLRQKIVSENDRKNKDLSKDLYFSQKKCLKNNGFFGSVLAC